MSKEKKTVTLSRGTPPASVSESQLRLEQVLSGEKPFSEGTKPSEENIVAAEPNPSEEKVETCEPSKVEPASEQKSKPSIIGKLSLEGEIVDLEIPYVDYQENDFSLIFILPLDTELGVRLKQSTSFVVSCPHVHRQQVDYVGPPMRFERTGLYLFFLLKCD